MHQQCSAHWRQKEISFDSSDIKGTLVLSSW